jgi:hypothetical protein
VSDRLRSYVVGTTAKYFIGIMVIQLPIAITVIFSKNAVYAAYSLLLLSLVVTASLCATIVEWAAERQIEVLQYFGISRERLRLTLSLVGVAPLIAAYALCFVSRGSPLLTASCEIVALTGTITALYVVTSVLWKRGDTGAAIACTMGLLVNILIAVAGGCLAVFVRG